MLWTFVSLASISAVQRVAPLARTPSAARAVPIASARSFSYSREGDIITFGAQEQFTVPVKPGARPVADYVKEGGKRLILASWDPSQVDELDKADHYTIRFQTLDFLVLKLRPEVDVHIFSRDGSAAFLSKGWRIPGLEEQVSLDSYRIKVRGEVRASPPTATMPLFRAYVEFEVSGQAPQVLSAVPDAASRAAAEQLCNTLLAGARTKFTEILPADYAKWLAECGAESAASSSR